MAVLTAAATAQAPDAERARWPYRFEVLDLEALFVDQHYQRPLTSFYKRIVANYDPALIGTLITSDRSTIKQRRFAVVDGQTRLEAMRTVGELVAPCLVYADLTRKDEARLFSKLQTERRGMATFLRFRAALVSGDPEASAIAALVRKSGFKVSGDGNDKGISAIAALEWLYRRDPELLLRVLDVISKAWPKEEEIGWRAKDIRVRGEILKGIGRLLSEDDIKQDRLADRLAGITPSQLRLRANALREGSGSSGSWDRFIRDAALGVYASPKRGG